MFLVFVTINCPLGINNKESFLRGALLGGRMTRFSVAAVICIFCFSISSLLFAKDGIVLNAKEVSRLLVGNTVTITIAKADKKTGEKDSFRAFISHAGVVHTAHKTGATRHYSWAIRDDGSFCLKNNMRRKGGASCGFFYREKPGLYELYKVKGAASKGGRVVAVKRAKLQLTVTNITKGEKLQ